MGWVFTQHSKGGFCLCRPKLPPWNQCLLKTVLREKQNRKESSFKTERKEENIARFLGMFTAPSNVPWLVGTPNLKDDLSYIVFFLPEICKMFAMQLRSIICRYFWSISVDSQPRPRDFFLTLGAEDTCPWILPFKKLPPMRLPFTNLGSQGLHLGTTRPSAGLSQLPKIVPHYTPQGLAGINSSLKETTSSEMFMTLLWVVAFMWPQEVTK